MTTTLDIGIPKKNIEGYPEKGAHHQGTPPTRALTSAVWCIRTSVALGVRASVGLGLFWGVVGRVGERGRGTGGRRPGPERVGFGGGVPGLLRGHPPREALVGALGVVDLVEDVHLGLQLGEGAGQGLGMRVAHQGLAEALVLAQGGGVCR